MVTFEVLREKVYEEVAQTTSYTGDKMTGDEGAYERIFTTDEDQGQLERFWRECSAAFCEKMRRFLVSDKEIRAAVPSNPGTSSGGTIMDGTITDVVTLASAPALQESGESEQAASVPISVLRATGHQFELEFSSSFDPALVPSMKEDLFSYFVMGITSKWYGFCNKSEAGEYAAAAASLLEGIHRKACYKRKPTRPTYNQ